MSDQPSKFPDFAGKILFGFPESMPRFLGITVWSDLEWEKLAMVLSSQSPSKGKVLAQPPPNVAESSNCSQKNRDWSFEEFSSKH